MAMQICVSSNRSYRINVGRERHSFKGDRIVLPEALQNLSTSLAHSGSHPMQSGIEGRLRFHFFFHDMQKKVAEFVKTCQTCSFTDKKTRHSLKAHEVPAKN